MKHKITLIPGDGIGPEVALAMKRCVEATGVDIQWDEFCAGEEAIKKFGTPLPEAVIESVRCNKVAIKGPIVTPVGSGFRSVNVQLRHALDLYACLRPARSLEGVRTPFRDVDLVIVRENSEDLYIGIEFQEGTPDAARVIEAVNSLSAKKIRSDSGISIKPISRFATRRIVRFAFEYAVKNNRKKVTAVHKANIMKHTDGLFLSIAREMAAEYAGRVEFNDAIVDNLSMQLVTKPRNFDVLVLPNLYGDIISDLCAGLIGGLGVAPGANMGDGIALFEPVHGAAPKYTGLNKVNPTATILSAVMMLEYLGEAKAAARLDRAVKDVIKEGRSVTYDLKADRNDPTAATTSGMADEIIKKIEGR